MTRAERRAWRSDVFGHRDLTLAQKLVLLALETYADYPEGTNARPGAARLAENCRLSVRVVEGALAIGQRLKLIDQTARANPKRGHAACYSLLSTCTGVQVEDDVSTCTGVQVEDDFQPARDDVSTCTDRISTCTPVQPTNPLHQSITPIQGVGRVTNMRADERAEGDEPVDVEIVLDSGNDPPQQRVPEIRLDKPADAPVLDAEVFDAEIVDDVAADLDPEPSRYCDRHPDDTPDPCGPCIGRRIAHDQWLARHPPKSKFQKLREMTEALAAAEEAEAARAAEQEPPPPAIEAKAAPEPKPTPPPWVPGPDGWPRCRRHAHLPHPHPSCPECRDFREVS